MSRVGRDDRLCHWMKADCWIGMAVHDIFTSSHTSTVVQTSLMYEKIIGPEARKRMQDIREPISVAVRTSSLVASDARGIEKKIADLFQMLMGIWLLPNDLIEDPTSEWLRQYLTNKREHSLYDAWSKADKIWSVYSFFCWQQTSDPKVALSMLADTAGLRSPRELATMDDFKQACLAANS